MAEESAQEKTEDPTPKRLEKALEDGQVLTSKELFVFSTLFTGFLMYFLILRFQIGFWGNLKVFLVSIKRFSGRVVADDLWRVCHLFLSTGWCLPFLFSLLCCLRRAFCPAV